MSNYPDDFPPFQEEPYGESDFDKAAKHSQDEQDYEDGFESVDSGNIYDDEGYLLDDSDYFDDWGDYDDDEEVYAMPLDEIVEIIDIDIIVTNEGFLLKKEIHILANGDEVPHEYILEIGCHDGQIPF